MFIKSITLYNYKNFKNKYTLDLRSSPSDNKNIVLIGGENGTGKTSIFEAINLCLYGKNMNGLYLSKKEYKNYIKSLKNKYSEDQRFFISIDLEINESLTSYILTIKRVWDLNEKTSYEHLYINRDGSPLEIIPNEYWQDYLLSMIPPHISQYFFFNGEKVKELASGDKAEAVLKDSIKEIIGLNIYDVLYKDLSELEKKTKRRNIDEAGAIKKLSENEKAQYQIQRKIDEIEERILKNEKRIELLKGEEIKQEDDLRRQAGAYAKERKINEEKIMKIKENLNDIEVKIKKLCGDFLPFNIATELNCELKKQLNDEQEIKNFLSGMQLLKNTEDMVIKRIKESKNLSRFTKDKKDLIKEELSSIFKEMKGEIRGKSKKEIIHDLSPSVTNSIINYLSKIDFRKSLENYLRTREKYLSKLNKIRNELNQVPEEYFVADSIRKITSIKTKINSLKKENLALQDEKTKIQEKYTLISKVISEIEKNIYCLEEDKRKFDLILSIKNILKEYTDKLIRLEIKELEEYISNMYKKLSNKKDMVKKVKIDRKSFIVSLYDYKETIHDKNTISEGEKEIYALSVLWSLSKISDKQLPIIIDSPLQKLDSTHVGNIITEFIPNAAHQVIILSHDREIDRSSYVKIKPFINKAYTLSKKMENKVKEGYFPNKFKNDN